MARVRRHRRAARPRPPGPGARRRRGQPRRGRPVRPSPGGDRSGRHDDLRAPGALDRRPDPGADPARRRRGVDRARRAARDARPAHGRVGARPGLAAAHGGLPGDQCRALRRGPRDLRRRLRAATRGRRLAAADVRLARGGHDQRRARGRPSLTRPRRDRDHRVPGDAGRRDPGAVGRSRPAGTRRPADGRGAARRRPRQLLPGLRRPAAPPGQSGGRPDARPAGGGHRRGADAPDLRADPALGTRRCPADPSGAAHRGVLPHPGAPFRRRHDRAGRPRAGDLGLDGGSHPLGLVPPRPRGRPAARLRPRGRPQRAVPRPPPGGRRGRHPRARVPAARARRVVAAVRDRPHGRSVGGPGDGPRGPGGRRPAAGTGWSCTCATWPGDGAGNWSSSAWPTPTT